MSESSWIRYIKSTRGCPSAGKSDRRLIFEPKSVDAASSRIGWLCFRRSTSFSVKGTSNRQGIWTIHRLHQVPSSLLDAGYMFASKKMPLLSREQMTFTERGHLLLHTLAGNTKGHEYVTYISLWHHSSLLQVAVECLTLR